MAEQGSRSTRAGFTLMEILVVVAIVVVLAGVGGVAYMNLFGQSKDNIAYTKIKMLDQQVQAYKLRVGHFPGTLNLLMQPEDGGKKFVTADALLDPWDREFSYDPNGTLNNGEKPDIGCKSPESGKQIGSC